MEQVEAEQLKSQLIERLKSQGYEVEHGEGAACKWGRSGAEHAFAIVAHRDDGLIAYTIAVDMVVNDEGEKIGLSEVFGFDDRCYDCGIKDKVLIAVPGLDPVATRFALNQRIKVFDERSLKTFLETPLPQVPNEKGSSNWKTSPEIIESLTKLGYKIERNARIKGKSGTEYTFDALATLDDGFVNRTLGIDDITSDEAGLTQVSLFDTKAYDAGLQEKVLLLSGQLSPEAKQFADHQNIRALVVQQPADETGEVTEKPSTELQTTVEDMLSEAEKSRATQRVLKRRADPKAVELIPESMARRFRCIPVAVMENVLQVAMANPNDIFALEALALQSRRRIEPIAANAREVQDAIDFNYRGGFGQIAEQISRMPGTTVDMDDEQALILAAEDTPVASALRLVIDEAAKARSSDVHIEPEEDKLRIRYRVDGVLQEVMSLPLKIHLPLTSRIKIMADMNIADHLRPQDGQFSTETKGRSLDIRVATVPTVHGEATVMRLLDKSLGLIELPGLGLSPESLANYQNMLKVAFGMILISGPTGSGKTTTLYASINQMDKTTRKIITIEDPVEYRFANINQIQIHPKAGLTFASGLRSILRLDPDVILVGEIRDAETARIAVQSALTGHLVLSSIHANDAVGVIFRLLDLGIEPFLVSSAVIGVMAQRMVRKVCPDCAGKREASLMEQLAYVNETGERQTQFSYGEGCDLCGHAGYRGRTGLFEVLPISDKIRMQILNRAGTAEVRQQAIDEGMVTLMKDGMLKVKEGITTPSEVLRNAYSIE